MLRTRAQNLDPITRLNFKNKMFYSLLVQSVSWYMCDCMKVMNEQQRTDKTHFRHHESEKQTPWFLFLFLFSVIRLLRVSMSLEEFIKCSHHLHYIGSESFTYKLSC